jgi:hypothetical protein
VTRTIFDLLNSRIIFSDVQLSYWTFLVYMSIHQLAGRASNISRDIRNFICIETLRSIIQWIRLCPTLLVIFRNKLIFYGEELLAPRPTPAEGPPLVGCLRLLIYYIRSYPPYMEAVSSIRNLRTRHAVVTKGPPNMDRRETKWQEVGENCIMRSFITCTRRKNIIKTMK